MITLGWRRRCVRVAALTLALGMLAIGMLALTGTAGAGPPVALDDVPRTYAGPDYGASAEITPTRYEGQEKLWFHDDAWWALLLEPSGVAVRVAELMPDHSWRGTGTVIDASAVGGADVLPVDDAVYVVARRPDSAVQLVHLTYDPGARTYLQGPTGPVFVTRRGNVAPPSIARDTTGRLWVTLATTREVLVLSSGDDGATWSAPYSLTAATGTLTRPEAAAVVAFDESIGVLWSDQAAGAFRFAVHLDGAPAEEWRVETALDGQGLVDDHISLKVLDREPGDAVVAAVKTSQGDQAEPPDSPLILVLSRAPDGIWSSTPGSTVADGLNGPMIQLDATNGLVHLFAHGAASVFWKQAPLDALTFPPGRGRPFVTSPGRPAEASGSPHPVDARTGLVVLAAGELDRRYYHGELRIPGEPPPAPEPDVAAPDLPANLVARGDAGFVSLSWFPSGDGTRWAPGADRAPVRGYTVLRDGVEVGTTGRTSFADDPPGGSTYEYAVRAVDFAGNASAPAVVTVILTERGVAPVVLASWILLGSGAAFTVAVGFGRWARLRAG